MKRKPLIIAITVILIVIIALLVAKKAGWIGKETGIPISTEKAVKRTITEVITANGKIQPETQVKISPEVPGEITELMVREGDEVKKGDLLVVIKPDIYISTLNRVKASLNSTKARLAQTEAQLIEKELAFKRAQKLFNQKTISKQEFESAESAYKVAKSEVEAAKYSMKSAEASVSESQESLIKTKIYAPISGTVAKLNVEKGERVVGTNQFAGSELMTIADLSKMEVKVDVNENDIININIGDTCLVEVDAYLNRKFKGLVKEIANSANATANAADQVTTFYVKVRLLESSYKDLISDKSKYPFRPGMSATVDILAETHKNVVSVPIQAVTTRKINEDANNVKGKKGTENADVTNRSDKQEVVFLYRNNKAVKVPIKTGIQDNTYIEVLQGVKEGDEIITAPFNAVSKLLKDSLLVKKVDKKQLFAKETK
ncbi:MAG: efflux RND transporter periplasmic adaptor subunit [Bacteroidota bacterium]|nr:efflux RND transporter periplasmic adaptor subunit [Bacteroidota bacterium]